VEYTRLRSKYLAVVAEKLILHETSYGIGCVGFRKMVEDKVPIHTNKQKLVFVLHVQC